MIYGYCLLQGANYLSDGSEMLLEILDPGLIGGGRRTELDHCNSVSTRKCVGSGSVSHEGSTSNSSSQAFVLLRITALQAQAWTRQASGPVAPYFVHPHPDKLLTPFCRAAAAHSWRSAGQSDHHRVWLGWHAGGGAGTGRPLCFVCRITFGRAPRGNRLRMAK